MKTFTPGFLQKQVSESHLNNAPYPLNSDLWDFKK